MRMSAPERPFFQQLSIHIFFYHKKQGCQSSCFNLNEFGRYVTFLLVENCIPYITYKERTFDRVSDYRMRRCRWVYENLISLPPSPFSKQYGERNEYNTHIKDVERVQVFYIDNISNLNAFICLYNKSCMYRWIYLCMVDDCEHVKQ